VIFQRLLDTLVEGRVPAHPLGLPGWGVVAANRSRMRGRLRAAVTTDVEALGSAVLPLPGLYERTAAALGRFAWDWAWREARSSFGFDLARMKAPPCEPVEVAPVRLRAFGRKEEELIQTFLLLVIGRGCWSDLEQWVAGGSTTELSKSFYRCLKQVPDVLADPMIEGQRVRRYTRLSEFLADGGIETYLPSLRAVAARVATLKPTRALKQELHLQLSTDWDSSQIELPAHHLPAFCEGFRAFLQSPVRASSHE
jgi:hypothetical protein